MKLRFWLSVIAIGLIVLIVAVAWSDIVQAFDYFSLVNGWILALMIPVQLVSYLATGEIIFSYLKSKGNMKQTSSTRIARMALELNFVNHVFPSGGASGVAYLNWRLKRHGVNLSRATMAQLVRLVMTFLSFVGLLVVALAVLVADHSVDRTVLLFSLLLVGAAVSVTLASVYVLSSRRRLDGLSVWLNKVSDGLVKRLTRGRRRELISGNTLNTFFRGLHDDYLMIRQDKALLVKPFIWAVVANLLDATLIFIAFWSFGLTPNFAVVLIAFGLASAAGRLMLTPGGVGAYEAVMVGFFATAGIAVDAAIAGTILARVLLLLGTIAFGYVFYQLTIVKYGKAPLQR